jgi:signal transduction histidine kinase
MSLRVKLLVVVLALGLLPSLALSLFHYRAGAAAVEDALRLDVEASAAQLAARLADELGERPPDPRTLEQLQPLQEYAAALGAGAAQAGAGARPARQLLALGPAGRIIFHTNPAYCFQQVGDVMPGFAAAAREMIEGRAGVASFGSAEDGARWLAAYRPVGASGASVAVARNYTAAVAPLRRAALAGAAAASLTALAAALLVFALAGRAARAVEIVTLAAGRVAAGDLEQRIEVETRDETRALAESFNVMTDRLREQLRREAESRQFQSFFRLSSMLAHDLKNSITGLSFLVSNMERHIHREEFRSDAIASVRDATEKLRGMVARLSEPVETLSGEYRRALQPTDMAALVRRALASAGDFHEVEARLPEGLVAAVDAERIERVVENLVLNAVQAMGTSHGRLTVEAGRAGAGEVFVEVSDTGPGMSEEFVRTRLFRPFSTTKNKGIGLGLYTCREIVQAHGGRIEVETRQGSGTRFRVVLPSDPATHSRAAAQPPN